jgi:hypothetical protein
MPIKLQVVKRGADADEPADYLFEQERLTIGRGTGNDLTLPDQKVSKQHAELRQENGQYLLTDLGSKNRTYLHGEALEAGQAHALQSGDVFTVGDFRIEFIMLFMPSAEQTVLVGGDDVNPFENHAVRLANVLKGVIEAYEMHPAGQREMALRQAFRGTFDERQGSHPALRQALELMGVDLGAPEGEAAQGEAQEPPEEAVLDATLTSLAKLVDIPRRFWHEFTGHTAMQTAEKNFLRRPDAQSLRNHLLRRDISPAERARRLAHLKEAADVLVQHEVAMLHGYMASATKGARAFMQRLRPAALSGGDGEQGGVFGKLFGGRDQGASGVQQRLEQKWKDVYHGDWAAIEKDDFRPAFVKAYMARMSPAMAGDTEKGKPKGGASFDLEAGEVGGEAPNRRSP